MTVGIGAICEANNNHPKVVVAADRLVTSGIAARREYEHTSSKMLDIFGADGNKSCVAVGVGAGTVSYADEVFYRVEQQITQETPNTTREIAEYASKGLQELVQEKINRRVLSPHGLDLQGFSQMQDQMNPQVVQGIYQDMNSMRDEILREVTILLAGVDDRGAHLFNVGNNDYSSKDSIGYLAVGSGAEPARASFIRNRYDDDCDVDDALLAVAEAKAQAEEAQGVGEDMDIAVLSAEEGRTNLGEDVDEVRSLYEDIVEAERDAREDLLEEEDKYTFET
jgi:hypothetical protein